MDAADHLALACMIPGEDECWLVQGWLMGSSVYPAARRSVVAWLIQVQQYLSLSDATLHLAVANFDKVISLVDFDTEEIQLLGLASLQLAAKVEEDCAPAPSLLVPLAGGVYSGQDLARMELEVLRTLDWRLRRTTSSVFLHYYTQIIGKEGRKVSRLARAILDLCLLEPWYGTVQPSHLAYTVLMAACNCLGQGWVMASITRRPMHMMTCVLDTLHRDNVEECIREKHGKILAKIKVLDVESTGDSFASVKEDLTMSKVNIGPGL